MHYKHMICVASYALGCMLAIPKLTAQQVNGHGRKAKIAQVTALLRRPGGLKELAKLNGEFVLEDQPELFSDLSLNTLIRGSLIITFVTIQSKNSRLVRNGDYIVTDYVFQPVEVFKGVFSKNESFSASGGKVVFPDATSAEITTVEWQTLAVGGQYILFLSESGDHYELTNGVESVFKISPSGTSLIPLASFDDSRPHAVLKDVRNYTPDSFKAFIRIQAASKK